MSECLKFCTRIEIESRFSLKMSVCGHELPLPPGNSNTVSMWCRKSLKYRYKLLTSSLVVM